MPSVGGLGTALAQFGTSLTFVRILAHKLRTLKNSRRGMKNMVEDEDDGLMMR